MRYPLITPKYYFTLFKELIGFIKKPKYENNLEKSVTLKIYDTIGLYFLKFMLLIPVILFFALVYDPENVQKANMLERFSPLVLLVVGGIILPLIEEVAFRLSLKFKPIYIALSSSVFSYYALTKIVFQTKISAIDESFMIRVVIAIALGLLLYPVVNSTSIKERLANFWRTHFRSIYYISCVCFAWIHITKYELNLTNILLLPILTLPQLMSALIYGYIRTSFGFKYPLFFHMSSNLLAISLSLLPFTD
ncbi:hypothetical protein ATO12_14515 [Aquimarina atlantica]|uniref:Abortive infection protein n=1 Tax=Aquimarina atlantica TaxID=1317122 RepID=A0A023BVU0_9FLAO|nr:hypothetical protein [Aquimarina atlantica]EZH74085.1 hypothetical protein ATO12_14515 [Aquimarina atlantica]